MRIKVPAVAIACGVALVFWTSALNAAPDMPAAHVVNDQFIGCELLRVRAG